MQLLLLQLRLHPTAAKWEAARGHGGLVERVSRGKSERGGWAERAKGEGRVVSGKGAARKAAWESGHWPYTFTTDCQTSCCVCVLCVQGHQQQAADMFKTNTNMVSSVRKITTSCTPMHSMNSALW